MKLLLTTALFGLTALTASARPAQCYVEINALVVIDGACDFSAYGGDGSFQIATPDRSYFIDVAVRKPGEAEGYWNEIRWANHAHSPLGTLSRDDACWRNGLATVCAW